MVAYMLLPLKINHCSYMLTLLHKLVSYIPKRFSTTSLINHVFDSKSLQYCTRAVAICTAGTAMAATLCPSNQ